jgi:hypothetical protein
MHITQPPTHTLAVRVQCLQQLFNSLDPSPFLNKDLDVECEAFIESWALLLPHSSHLELTIQVEEQTVLEQASELVSTAVHNHYVFKSNLVRAELRQLFRLGRTSLMVGLAFVVSCLLLAEAISSIVPGPFARIAKESLTIIGWVAMWRPVQIFLYDWWPLAGRIRVFQNLRYARVRVEQTASNPK